MVGESAGGNNGVLRQCLMVAETSSKTASFSVIP